jgi:hypothetical protein
MSSLNCARYSDYKTVRSFMLRPTCGSLKAESFLLRLPYNQTTGIWYFQGWERAWRSPRMGIQYMKADNKRLRTAAQFCHLCSTLWWLPLEHYWVCIRCWRSRNSSVQARSMWRAVLDIAGVRGALYEHAPTFSTQRKRTLMEDPQKEIAGAIH